MPPLLSPQGAETPKVTSKMSTTETESTLLILPSSLMKMKMRVKVKVIVAVDATHYAVPSFRGAPAF